MIYADDDISEQKLTVIFDDTKTSVEAIMKTMAKEGYPVQGEPEFLSK